MQSAVLAGLGRQNAVQGGSTQILRRIRAYFISRRAQRETLDQLEMTTDRELADMGLSRLDIRQIAARAGSQAAEKFLSA